MSTTNRIADAIEASRLTPDYAKTVAAMVRDGALVDAADYLDVLDDAYGLGGADTDQAFSDQMTAWSRELREEAEGPAAFESRIRREAWAEGFAAAEDAYGLWTDEDKAAAHARKEQRIAALRTTEPALS